jgi:hypothetical protein
MPRSGVRLPKAAPRARYDLGRRRLDGIDDGSEFPPSSDITANQATKGVTPTCTFHQDVSDAVPLQGGGCGFQRPSTIHDAVCVFDRDDALAA